MTRFSPRKNPAAQIKKEIIEAIKKAQSEGVIEDNERLLIEGIVRFNEVLVSDVMTPRTDMVSLDLSASVEEAMQIAAAKGHLRIPVHARNRDAIEGVLYVRDILPFICGEGKLPEKVRDVMRKPLFVPATKRISTLLREFQRTREQLAIVVDEYGGTAGLVTVEDIIEEIVGEMPGAPRTETQIERLDSYTIIASGRARTEEINSRFGLTLPEGEGFETIGGLLSRARGKIPKAGDTYYHEGACLKAMEADERRVRKVQITLPQQQK